MVMGPWCDGEAKSGGSMGGLFGGGDLLVSDIADRRSFGLKMGPSRFNGQ